jgi:hypothetical protein
MYTQLGSHPLTYSHSIDLDWPDLNSFFEISRFISWYSAVYKTDIFPPFLPLLVYFFLIAHCCFSLSKQFNQYRLKHTVNADSSVTLLFSHSLCYHPPESARTPEKRLCPTNYPWTVGENHSQITKPCRVLTPMPRHRMNPGTDCRKYLSGSFWVERDIQLQVINRTDPPPSNHFQGPRYPSTCQSYRLPGSANRGDHFEATSRITAPSPYAAGPCQTRSPWA